MSGIEGHTPGPWNEDWWYAVLRDLHNFAGAGFLTDDEYMPEGFGYPGFGPTDNARHDAALIASAPTLKEQRDELLEALKGLVAFGEEHWALDLEEHEPAYVAAQAAIRKAEGGEG